MFTKIIFNWCDHPLKLNVLLLTPGGILSVIVDAYLDGTIEDALLVPVSMNYEKLVDGNFVREQLGMPKQMETFGAAMKAIYKVLNSHYGSIRIDFNQPFSMRVSKLQSLAFCNNPLTIRSWWTATLCASSSARPSRPSGQPRSPSTKCLRETGEGEILL